jgi:hypothetical protein
VINTGLIAQETRDALNPGLAMVCGRCHTAPRIRIGLDQWHPAAPIQPRGPETTGNDRHVPAIRTRERATHSRASNAGVKQKLTSLDFPATRWSGPSRVIDTEARWEQARRLLRDGSLDPEDRVAGLLVLLYAQWPSVISRLTLGHVHADDQQVRLNLGREPVILPEPLAGLVRQLLATRRGHAAIAGPQTTPWLFPGGQPGRPISSYRLAERLRELGINAGDRLTARSDWNGWPAVLNAADPGEQGDQHRHQRRGHHAGHPAPDGPDLVHSACSVHASLATSARPEGGLSITVRFAHPSGSRSFSMGSASTDSSATTAPASSSRR